LRQLIYLIRRPSSQDSIPNPSASGRAFLQSVYDNNILGLRTAGMSDPGRDATAAYQSMVKNAGILTRQAVVQTHERAALAMTMVQKSLPSSEMSPQGFDLVTSEMQGLNDFKLAKEQGMNKTPVGGRSDKFNAEWNKNVDPTYFILHRMQPADQDKVLSDLQKTDEGRRVLRQWQQTDAYLKNAGR
jgi:hypothetical protein